MTAAAASHGSPSARTIRHVAGPQGRLALEDAGPADAASRSAARLPVLFVHSDLGNFTQWREALDHVRLTRRAAALDLRGHGRSAPPADGDLSYAGRAADVAAVADALSLERLVLVGHSGGAGAATYYAAHHADRVAGLLLVDPAPDGRQFPEDQRRQFMEQLRSPGYAAATREYYASIAGSNDEVRERILWDAGATPQATMIGTFEALGSYDPAPAVRAYRGPRLSLVTPINQGPASLHGLDPSLPHRVVEGTGHWLHLDDPAGFRATLDEFLGEVERA